MARTRLDQHADYLDRQGRQSLAAELRLALVAEEEVQMLHEILARIASEAGEGLEETETGLRSRMASILSMAKDVV